MELNAQVDAFAAKGLKLAAISYDSPAVLKHFHEKRKLRYPLLSDEGSKIIRDFGILNEAVKPGTPFAGIPHPGTYVISPDGKVVSKHFEDDYTERDTGGAILVQDFGAGAAAGMPHESLTTRHLKVSTSATAKIVRGGQKVALLLDIELAKKMHVYAQGAVGYRPIDWRHRPSPAIRVSGKPVYPTPRTLYLKPIQEKAPIHDGAFRSSIEITFANQKTLQSAANAEGEISIEGDFYYQACDDKVCYTPQIVPLRWKFRFEGHDGERAPKELRKF